MDIVTKTGCFQLIGGKKYLQVEAWETIGAFNRVHAVTESVVPIIQDGVMVGYDAKVTLINHDGMLVGAAIMPCYFTESACKGKVGDAKDKACKSAAQTFATSKAYRMNYSYVAILAGYQPTPAEEMTGEAVDDRPANLEHWCEKHQTKFFKRGKMKAYAHPIQGTEPTEWCQEDKPIHTVEQVAREMAEATTIVTPTPAPKAAVTANVEGLAGAATLPSKEEILAILEKAGMSDPIDFNDWIKSRFEGITWGKLNNAQKIDALQLLQEETK